MANKDSVCWNTFDIHIHINYGHMPFDHFMAIKFVCVDVVLCTKAMAILECQWILETKYMRQIHLKEKKSCNFHVETII